MQTSYSVDRAGTAEQEAEAAEEALLADAPEGSGPAQRLERLKDIHSVNLISDSEFREAVTGEPAPPKRVRRTREQIEQEKIEKAQQRIEAIKADQRNRRVAKAHGLLRESFRALEPSDMSVDTFGVFIDLELRFGKELGK